MLNVLFIDAINEQHGVEPCAESTDSLETVYDSLGQQSRRMFDGLGTPQS